MNTLDRPFYVTGGSLPSDATSYIVRQADADLLENLRRGRFCYVLDARQVGKSSLMVRTAARLREEGCYVVVLDLTAVGQNVTAEQWYAGLLYALSSQLGLLSPLECFWMERSSLGPAQRWIAAIREVILTRSACPLMIFVDEIDAVRGLPFTTDEFFAAIRQCYNHRSQDETFERLTFCLLGVATPADLIRDPHAAPFNVGVRVEPSDFTEVEALPLACGFSNRARDVRATFRRVLYWTGGHPYLTQRLCQAVAESNGGASPHEVDRLCHSLFLTGHARESEDNLALVQKGLLNPDFDIASLLELYGSILAHPKSLRYDPTDARIGALRLAGVVRVAGGMVWVRNRIYARVFDRRWIAEHMPDAERRRQRAAYYRGLWRASIVVTALAGLILWAIVQREQVHEANARAITVNRKYESEQARTKELVQTNQTLQVKEQEKEQQIRVDDARISTLHKDLARLNARVSAARAIVRQAEERARTALQQEADARRKILATRRTLADLTARYSLRPLFSRPDKEQDVLNRGVREARAYLRSGRNPPADLVDDLVKAYTSDIFRIAMFAHPGKVSSASYSPDGTQIVTVGEDRVVRVWNSAHHQLVFSSDWAGTTAARAWFDDGGAHLVITDGRRVHVWNAQSWNLEVSLPDYGKEVLAARYAQGYCWVALRGPNNTVFVKNHRFIGNLVLVGHTARITSADFSPDGQWIVTGSEDKTARTWRFDGPSDQPSAKLMRTFTTHWAAVVHVSAHRDCVISASANGQICRWQHDGVRTDDEYDVPPGAHLSAQQTPLESKLVVIGGDGCVRVVASHWWSREIFKIQPSRGVRSADLSVDDRTLLLVNGDGKMELWTMPFPVLVGQFGPVYYAEFSRDGRRIVTASGRTGYGSAYIWDRSGGHHLMQLGAAHDKGHRDAVFHCTFSPDGNYVVTASKDRERSLILWHLVASRSLPPQDPVQLDNYQVLADHVGAIHFVVFTPDGRRFATAESDGRVRVWETATGICRSELRGHQGDVRTAYFAPDGKRLLTAGTDGQVLLWEPPYRKPRLIAHYGKVRCAAWSPDGQRIVLSLAKEPARVINLAGKAELVFKGEASEARWARFSPDGSRIVTTASDNTTRLWDARTGANLLTYRGHQRTVWTTEFSPNGRYVVTASDDGTARIFPATLETLLTDAERILGLGVRTQPVAHTSARYVHASRRFANVKERQ